MYLFIFVWQPEPLTTETTSKHAITSLNNDAIKLENRLSTMLNSCEQFECGRRRPKFKNSANHHPLFCGKAPSVVCRRNWFVYSTTQAQRCENKARNKARAGAATRRAYLLSGLSWWTLLGTPAAKGTIGQYASCTAGFKVGQACTGAWEPSRRKKLQRRSVRVCYWRKQETLGATKKDRHAILGPKQGQFPPVEGEVLK